MVDAGRTERGVRGVTKGEREREGMEGRRVLENHVGEGKWENEPKGAESGGGWRELEERRG